MGIELHLVWIENGQEKYEYVMKLSVYPYELIDKSIPDKTLPNSLHAKYLSRYLSWLKHVEFLVNNAPEIYMGLNKTSNTIEQIREGLNEDIDSVKKAISKKKHLKRNKITVWLSVG